MKTQKRMSAMLLVLAAVLLVAGGAVMADTFEWKLDGDGDWENAANWTLLSGSSGREYPNDSDDNAHFTNNISGDVTVTVPAGGVAVKGIVAGDADASHVFTLTGGTITSATSDSAIEMRNGATLQLDANMMAANFADLRGNGLLIVNGTMSNNRVWNLRDSTFTARINGQLNTSNDDIRVQAGARLEIGNDNFTSAPNGFQLNGGGNSFSAYGADRNTSRPMVLKGDLATFDGSNGFDFETSGNVTFEAPGGRAVGVATIQVRGAVFSISGSLALNLADGTRTFERHPVRLLDGGTLNLKGTSVTSRDLVLDGVGSLLLNNTTGSATGTGNSLIVGRQNHVAGSAVSLKGTGSTDSALIMGAGGTVAPGSSVGTLTVNNHVSFEAGAAYEWERDAENTDLLVVTGDLTIADAFEIKVVQHAIDSRDAIDIITYTGDFTGTPSAWTLTPPVGSEGFDNLGVEDTGTAIRLTGLPTLPSGTVIFIK